MTQEVTTWKLHTMPSLNLYRPIDPSSFLVGPSRSQSNSIAGQMGSYIAGLILEGMVTGLVIICIFRQFALRVSGRKSRNLSTSTKFTRHITRTSKPSQNIISFVTLNE